MRWMSLAEAVRCSSSFEALVVGVINKRILTRADFFQHAETGNLYQRKDNVLPAWWWEEGNPRVVDVATGRILFAAGFVMADGPPPEDILAIGIELEAGAVEALWPVDPKQPQSAPAETLAGMIASAEKKAAAAAKRSRRKSSRPRSKSWPKIFEHFDQKVETQGKYPNAHAAATAVSKWIGNKLSFDAIYKGIPKWRPEWIGPDSKE